MINNLFDMKDNLVIYCHSPNFLCVFVKALDVVKVSTPHPNMRFFIIHVKTFHLLFFEVCFAKQTFS